VIVKENLTCVCFVLDEDSTESPISQIQESELDDDIKKCVSDLGLIEDTEIAILMKFHVLTAIPSIEEIPKSVEEMWQDNPNDEQYQGGEDDDE